MRRLWRAWVPHAVRRELQRVLEVAYAKPGPSRFECPICGGRFRRFLAAGDPPRPDARCPRCASLERHRLQWLYLQRRTDVFERPLRLLHFAPEECFIPRFRGASNVTYVTTDLEMAGVSVRSDATRLAFRAGSFDVVLCSHVLEHVPDDGAAMRELRRVLRPGGWAILQVPLDETRERTFEDPTIRSPEDRRRHFGQADHVRIYGRDFHDRLESAGFSVQRSRFPDEIAASEVDWHALRREPIIIARSDTP